MAALVSPVPLRAAPQCMAAAAVVVCALDLAQQGQEDLAVEVMEPQLL